MVMKNYLKLIAVILITSTSVNAQTDDYEMTKTYASVDPTPYVKAMNQMFRLDTMCSSEILITHINGNKTKNKYVSCPEIRTYLTKHYFKPDQRKFKLNAETNNGYVLVIGQFGKDPDIAIRFFTIFIEPLSGKINVIEIEENK
jgi:hypothetical protein